MTKEEARRFKENWAVVNQLSIEEERRKTPEERLRGWPSCTKPERRWAGINDRTMTKRWSGRAGKSYEKSLK